MRRRECEPTGFTRQRRRRCEPLDDFSSRLRTEGGILLQTGGHDFLPQRVDWLRPDDVEFLAPEAHRRRNSFTNLTVDVPRIERWLAREEFVDRGAE